MKKSAQANLKLSTAILCISTFLSYHGFASAPHGPGNAPLWAQGNKDWVGTSYETYDSHGSFSSGSSTAPISKVWFTLSQGILNEVYFPTIDEAQLRDSQLLISDGKSFFHEERQHTLHSIVRNPQHPLDVVFINRDPGGRYEIAREVIADPDGHHIWIKLQITSRDPKLAFYLLHNTAVGNTGWGDSCSIATTHIDAKDKWLTRAQRLMASVPFEHASCGFVGTPSDGFQDLSKNFALTQRYETAHDGNTVAVAQLPLTQDGVIILRLSLAESFNDLPSFKMPIDVNSFQKVKARYLKQWTDYLSTLHGLSSKPSVLETLSAYVLKVHEDKTHSGAFVASLSIPWGDKEHREGLQPTTSLAPQRQVGGYHLVWPRDLYHVAMGLLSAGDSASARAALLRLKHLQLGRLDGEWPYPLKSKSPIRRHGSYWQNTWVDGTPYWTQLQLDQVAAPILLGFRLWQDQVVQKDEIQFLLESADFIRDVGPWTMQERWEESHGVSPSTIAAAVAALASATELADALGQKSRAETYRLTALKWMFETGNNLDTWTFTTKGDLGNGKYYIRIDGAGRNADDSIDFGAPWEPNDDRMMLIANRPREQASFKEKNIVDGGFLELVRYGVKSGTDENILESLPEVDQHLRVETAKGPSFYRYNHDGYGESGKGRLWVLLTGERGHLALEQNEQAIPYLKAMERFANVGGMLPEQVWEAGPGSGQGTGSATPLAWSHAEYLRLSRSIREKKVFDRNQAAVKLLGTKP